ncbi:MAG: hypothetical protein KatS3mg105_2849 [Gemmatales bacterium]|nr:MAG: hypothetical protein KatS3mg105_2849 [Gemmatales bacterium]
MKARYLLISLLASFMLFGAHSRRGPDVDMHWQLRLGQMILERGQLVTVDPFSFATTGRRLPTLSWLAQANAALLYQLGSWELVKIVDSLLFVGALVIVSFSRWLQNVRIFAVLVAMSLSYVIMLPHNSVRPQTYAFFCFAVLLWLLTSDLGDWTKLLGCAATLLLWQNLHASNTVAAFLLVPLFLSQAVLWWRGQAPGFPRVELGALVILAGSQFATPEGFGLQQVQWTTARLATMRGATEWFPLWHPGLQDFAWPFWVGLVGSIVLLVRLQFRVSLPEFALFLMMTAMGIAVCRLSVFAALGLLPVWARWLERALSPEWFAWRDLPEFSWPTTVAISVGSAALALAASWSLRPDFYAHHLPLPGIEALKRRLPEGRIVAETGWCGPLLFHGPPGWKVWMDNRLYLFTDDEWRFFEEVMAGRVPVRQIEERVHPDAFFLDPKIDLGLIELLKADANWECIFADHRSVVFVRR